MKYFKNIAESVFKLKSGVEVWLYYSNGILSKGRVVTDTKTKEKLFKFQRNIVMFGLPIVMIFGLFFSGNIYKLSSLLVLGLPVLFFLLCQHLAVKNLSVSNHKLNYKEATSITLQGVPNRYHKFLYFLARIIIVFGTSITIIFNKPFSELIFLTSMMLVIGVAIFITASVMQKQKAIQDA